MLIYNFQKEFVGIDEKDLTTLGFNNLTELRAEAADFADLFVKTPGYIHNFKHVHWIDFITCAESNDESKVIINVNNKNYRCILNITTAFLVDNPSSKAYLINLNHLRELTHEESESIAGDIIERHPSQGELEPQAIFNTAPVPEHSIIKEDEEHIIDEYDIPLEIEIEDEPLNLEIEDSFADIPQEIETNFDISDDKLDIDLEFDEEIYKEEILPTPVKNEIVEKSLESTYVYDPAIASHELGLPIDLIEEFIQDFIDQAKEFKEKLYIALDEGELDTLKILSHKLKGVAANLRVEDAFEVLTIANTSNDINAIRESLDTLYKIIARLAGEKISEEKKIIKEDLHPTSSYSDLPEIEISEEKIEINMQEDEDLYSDPIEIIEEDKEDNQEIEPLNYSKITTANEIGLDIDNFNILFDDYINEVNEIILSLRVAIENKDFTLCKNEALKLKGMSENMRINNFATYIDILINDQESQHHLDALNSIESVLIQLSKVGV